MSFVGAIFWNESEARLRAGWRLASQLILNIGLFLLILRLADSCADLLDSLWATVVLAPIAVGVTLLSVWFAGYFLDRRLFSDFGLHLKCRAWWADFCFGLMLGIVLPIGLASAGVLAGLARFEPAFTSGLPALSFGLAALLSVFLYLCVGVFEEVGRVYHIRNLLEGTALWLGPKNAAVVAVIGASAISVLMHSGNLAFLLFVLLATALKGLCYLLTGRAAIALAYHAAWDFTMATVLGVGAQDGTSATTVLYIVRFADATWTSGVSDNELALPIVVALLALELAALLLILGWIRLRYGGVKLRRGLDTPNLRTPEDSPRVSIR